MIHYINIFIKEFSKGEQKLFYYCSIYNKYHNFLQIDASFIKITS